MPIVFALLAGALTVLAYAPFDWMPLAFLGWGTLYFLMQRAKTPGTGFRIGLAWGFGHLFGGLCWIYVALHRYGGMPAPLAGLAIVLFAAFLALYPALSAWLFVRLRGSNWWRNALLAAACWALGEWLRGTLWTGFGWMAIGYTQTPPSPLAGWVPVLGVYGVGFLVAGLSALAVEALRKRSGFVGAIGAAVAVFGGGAALRTVQWTQPIGTPIAVALLQTNIPQDMKWQSERLMEWLNLNYDMVRRQQAPLVVLPETTLPLLESQLPIGYLDALQDMVAARGGNVIAGVFTQQGENIFNSAITRGAAPAQHYSKRHLVPFGEYSPPLFGWFYQWANIPMSDQTRGAANQAPLALNGQKIAVNICYEDVFGEELLYALPEATLLLNMSNLAWYGDSHAQPQHLQIARIRALETGRPTLRATNTGMTAIIQPDGQVTGVLPPFTVGALTAEVRGYTGLTPYARWANWPAVGVALLVIAWTGITRRREVTSLKESLR